MYNPYTLEGKTVFVAGASSGIGRELAIACSKAGACVHLLGRNEARLAETLSKMEEGNHQIHLCDITDDDQLDLLVDKLPALDGFANCVGVSKTMMLKFVSKKALTEIMETNALSPISLTQKLVRKKKFNKNASIVFVSSLAGVYTVHYGDSLNAASKGAINAFVKSAALDLSSQRIRVNSVNPGVVATEAVMANAILSEEELAEKQKFFPLRRFGQPADIALPIIYLLSDASSWITGIHLKVDGGYTLL